MFFVHGALFKLTIVQLSRIECTKKCFNVEKKKRTFHKNNLKLKFFYKHQDINDSIYWNKKY